VADDIRQTGRIGGLDSIRFLCAAIVMISHIGLLNDRLRGADAKGLARIVIGIFNVLFNAPAAVIVFFVISGFCIHFPFRNGRPMSAASFLSRRFIRIVLPALIFALIYWAGLKEKLNPKEAVTWSVICETIYYLLYPALLHLRRRLSWTVLLGAASLSAVFLLAINASLLRSTVHTYTVLGWETWIVGLPCWLLGCLLAEKYKSFPLLSTPMMWSVRAGVYATSVLLGLIRFHLTSPLASNCILLNLFAVLIFFWIGFEIAYAAKHSPVGVLEWAGTWSYSLYLVHPLVIPTLALVGLSFLTTNKATHFLLMVIALLASYGFYLLVERPSHHLAIMAGRALAPVRVPVSETANAAPPQPDYKLPKTISS
jgi:peptidoglycan/LPS O-acetylase OafA/YrhL